MRTPLQPTALPAELSSDVGRRFTTPLNASFFIHSFRRISFQFIRITKKFFFGLNICLYLLNRTEEKTDKLLIMYHKKKDEKQKKKVFKVWISMFSFNSPIEIIEYVEWQVDDCCLLVVVYILR